MKLSSFAESIDRQEESKKSGESRRIFLDTQGKLSSLKKLVDAGVARAKKATKIDLSHASVERLPGDTAGEYHKKHDRVKLDKPLIESGDQKTIDHVMIHEATHQQNERANRRRGSIERVPLVSVEFEEALTEKATKLETGKVMAYRKYFYLVETVASKTGTPETELIRLYKTGRNRELNDLYAQAFPEKVSE